MKEKYKIRWWEYNLLLMDRVADISVRRLDQQITGKKEQKIVNSDNQPIREAKRMFILPRGTWKDNIRSVILDWRQRSTGRSSKRQRSASLSSEGSLKQTCRECSPAVALFHKRGPYHRRKICANSLSLSLSDFTPTTYNHRRWRIEI